MKIFQGMTAKDLIEELQKLSKPELFFINVLNEKQQWSSHIEYWVEDLETRKFIDLKGLKPMREIYEEKRI